MLLEIRNLKKTFGEKEVLHGISFSAESGSAFGLLGRNGAGKTTTIRILMNVFHQNEGEILLDGKPFQPGKQTIGYLPEERGLYPKKTVKEQLVYLGKLRGMNSSEVKQQVKKWLERMELSEYENKKLETLSKGNQQKVQLIQTLIAQPEIIILDEPFSGLDPVNAMMLKDVIKDQIKDGKLVIFSSHQMNYVEEFCENIGIMNHGDMVLSGNLREIKKEFGKNRLVIADSVLTPSELSVKLEEKLGDILVCEKVRKDLVIVRQLKENGKKDIMKGLLEGGFDVEKFGLYEPSLSDIFVEMAGDEK